MDPTGGRGTRGTLPGVTGSPGVIGTTPVPAGPRYPAITEGWISARGSGPIGPGRALVVSTVLLSIEVVVVTGEYENVVSAGGVPVGAEEELLGRAKEAPEPSGDTPLCRW
jgi:hypothetical protein